MNYQKLYWITSGGKVPLPSQQNNPTASQLGAERADFIDYGLMLVEMIYKPCAPCPIQCRLIFEQGFSLFFLLLPTSPSKSTWVWEYLIVPGEREKISKRAFLSQFQDSSPFEMYGKNKTGFISHPPLLPWETRRPVEWREFVTDKETQIKSKGNTVATSLL